jgi:hypothetical protein
MTGRVTELLSELFIDFFLLPFPPNHSIPEVIMDMHAVAGVAVLLILAAVSAYRDALRNDPMSKIGKAPLTFPQAEETE